MEQLSSCYFCGAALDAQIEPYQVVPASLDPTDDQQRAVSLCPSCRQKLAHVVETVVEASDDGDATAAVDDVPDLDPEGALLDDEPGTATGADDAVADGQPTDASNDTKPEPEPTREGRSDDGSESSQSDADGQTQRTGSSYSHNGTGDDHGADRRRDGETRTDRASDERRTESAERRDDARPRRDGRDASDDAEADRTQQTHSAGDTGEEDDGPSLTALEYNKVMRLLQNREFPVERAEIHDIATSAYEISDREFDAIIDAAIKRGLIDEENGTLVSGD
ncbi:hypothetical protein IL252_14775 [Halomicrobium sp. IBSBa]|uniref:hypothetical protein n=1 Tax=Halomicrobium sp. IBSBa TaxID=2778916 RepID=UPI001ABF744E|nr:hypothetical protein [Halomicrobium sp. IBSBa]MBO4249080.1 hypothetical protein [Halomicrobium sp. IBSBa]